MARSEFRHLILVAIFALGSSHAFAQTPPPTAPDAPQPATLDQSVNADFDAALGRYARRERTKIVGGNPAPEGAHPWQVSLGVSWIPEADLAHFCGGSIYDARWIVTAAHCLHNTRPDYLTVVAGQTVLTPGSARVKAGRLFVHKDYDDATKDNDIGLIELAEPLSLAGATQAIGLLKPADEEAVLTKNRLLVVTGWGATTEGGLGVTQLQQLVAPFVERGACNDLLSYDGRVTENMICAGRSAGGQDSCQGDSGGPLVYRADSGAATLAGVVSWGEGCARPGRYGVYARVPRYAEWVEKCVADPDGCK